MTPDYERLAMRKIISSFLKGDGARHCQQDKDLMIKYLIQTVQSLDRRVHDLEAKQDRGGEVSSHDYSPNSDT